MSSVETLLLTRDQTAMALAICPRTVDALARDGELPAVRIGRAVRFAREDVEAFVARRRNGPAENLPKG